MADDCRRSASLCWRQDDPPRKLVNWQHIAVLSISGSGTYHRVYDACIPKWLTHAGGKTDLIRLGEVIKFIVSWLQKNVQRT